MRVGIIRCENNRKCPSTSCLRAIIEKDGGFANYEDIELVGITTCGGCPTDDIKPILERVEKLLDQWGRIHKLLPLFQKTLPD